MNFVEKYKNGKVEFKEIHDYVEKWHESDSTLSLAEYLGLTEQEYALWIEKTDKDLEKEISEKKVEF